MTFLPLIERELRARARNRVTYWIRFVAVLVGALICLPGLLSGEFGTTAGASGKSTFNGLVVIGFLLACCGSFLTADVLSRERREGTLGLLLLTRVRRLDVLLGKFGSAGLTSICALAALLPLMLLPVLAGGVTGGEAFRKSLALLNSLFLALAAGLWSSAGSLDQSRALGRTIRMMIALVVVPIVLEFIFQLVAPSHIPILGSVSTLFAAGDSTYITSAATYWISLFLVHAAGWALLVIAGRFLREATQSDDEIIPDRFTGDESYKSLKRKWRLAWTGQQEQPIEFLARRQRGIKTTLWAAVLIGLFLQFGAIFVVPFRLLSALRWLPINMISGALLAWAMSRFMIEARCSGAQELLMTTPVGARTIASAQWNGLKQLLRWPLLVMLLPYLLQILTVVWRSGPTWKIDQTIRQWAFIFFGMTNTFFGVMALCWAALWFGFKARNHIAAIIWTVGVAKGVPFFIHLISQGLFAVGIIPTGISSPYDIRWYIPQILILLFYVRLMVWVKARFLAELPGSEPLRFMLLRLVSQEIPEAKISLQTVR